MWDLECLGKDVSTRRMEYENYLKWQYGADFVIFHNSHWSNTFIILILERFDRIENGFQTILQQGKLNEFFIINFSVQGWLQYGAYWPNIYYSLFSKL